MPSTHINFHFHIVFSTKDRRRMIKDAWRDRLYSYIGTVIKNRGCTPLSINGTDDHIHLLFGTNSTVRIDYLVRDIKADSSTFVRDEFSGLFTWQKGYGGFTVSPSEIKHVRRYIENQEEHHRKASFKDEYVELLKENDTPFEEKYLW